MVLRRQRRKEGENMNLKQIDSNTDKFMVLLSARMKLKNKEMKTPLARKKTLIKKMTPMPQCNKHCSL